MRFRAAVMVGGLLAGVLTTLAPPASATPDPWTPGTVFAAASGMRHDGDGGLVAIAPDGSVQTIAGGTPTDVAVAPDGTVYWVDCDNYGLFSYTPGGTAQRLVYDANCATAVAVEPDGDLLLADVGHITRYAPDGTSLGSVYDTDNGYAAFGIAVDPADDIYFVDTYGMIDLLTPGAAAPIRISGTAYDGALRSLRLGIHSQVVAADPLGNLVAEVPLDGGATVTHPVPAYVKGAIQASNGDIYYSAIVDDPRTQDAVQKLSASDGSISTVATGLDNPEGLAIYPPVVPAPRSATSVTLTSAAAPMQKSYQQVTLRAAVSGATRGLVVFATDGNVLANPVPVSNGVARLRTQLPYGTDDITATFLGGPTTYPSVSSPLTFSVTPTPTYLKLSTPSLDVPDGSTTPVTATLTGKGNRDGNYVQFFVDGNQVDSAILSNGQATTYLYLTGAHPKVQARYAGDTLYLSSVSNVLTFTTTPPYLPTVSATASNGRTRGDGSQKVTIKVQVRGYYGVDRPTGRVTADNGFACSDLVAGSTATVSRTTCVNVLPAGASADVTLTYGGDTNYASRSTDIFVSVGGE